MKIAIVNIDDLYTQIHGVATFHRNLRKYVNSNADVELFYYSGAKKEKPVIKQLNSTFKSIVLPWSLEFYENMFFSFHPLSFSSSKKYFEKEFKKNAIDLVQISSQDPLSLAAINAAKSLDIPVIGSYHTRVAQYGENWLNNWLKSIKFPIRTPLTKSVFKILSVWSRRIFNKCDAILVTNQYMKNHLAKQQYDSAKMKIVGRGVDTQRYAPKEKKNKKTRVLYVGRVSTEKDLHELTFLNAPKDCELRVVGNGKMLKKLQKEIPSATFTGWLSGDQLTREYQNADLFVFPSKTDTFSNAVLEAMSCGLPIVGYNNQALNDRIVHNQNGMLARSPEEFQQYALSLIQDTKKRKQLGKKARACALKLSWEIVFENYLGIIKEIIKVHNKENKKLESKSMSLNEISKKAAQKNKASQQ